MDDVPLAPADHARTTCPLPAVVEVIDGALGATALGSNTHTARADSPTEFVLPRSAAVCANVNDVEVGTDATVIVYPHDVANACKPHNLTVSPALNPWADAVFIVTTFEEREYVVTRAPFGPLAVSHVDELVNVLPLEELIPELDSVVQLSIVLFVNVLYVCCKRSAAVEFDVVNVEFEITEDEEFEMTTAPLPLNDDPVTVSGIAMPPIKNELAVTPDQFLVPEIVTFTISVGSAELIAQLFVVK